MEDLNLLFRYKFNWASYTHTLATGRLIMHIP